MKKMLINAQPDEVRVAITDNSLLIDLDIEYPGIEQKKANIYKSRITSIEPSLGAVFVDFGAERHGFLPLKEITPDNFLDTKERDKDNPDINKLVKLGQEIVIQVEKEERGTKGAALTSYVSLAGSFLVLMPNNPRAGGISRRIDNDEERDQLRDALKSLEVPHGMGVIIRTAGVGKSTQELQWDLDVLLRYWDAIQSAAKVKPAPYLIHQESDVVIRGIRDNLRADTQEIIIDDPEAFDRVKSYIGQVRPDFVDRIKLYQENLPLFSRFQIEQQIETAYQHEVRLPSGGSLVIDMTEALVSIDINSSRATKGADIEETALNTNLEAAEEIARQMRLRDIGGLIVIDFIDMTPARNQREVENRLREALRVDRARVQISRISRFGLLEMSRQRLRASLNRSTQEMCPRCNGQGTIRSVESLALSILHLLQEKAVISSDIHIQAQLPVDVATFILNEKRAQLREVEQLGNIKITIIPNPHVISPNYIIKQNKLDAATIAQLHETPSYKMMKQPRDEQATQKRTQARHFDVPMVKDILNDPGTPSNRKSSGPGILQKLRQVFFGSDESSTTSSERKKSTHGPKQHSRSRGKPRRARGGRGRGGQQQRRDGQRRDRNDSKDGRDSRGGRGRGGRGGQQRRTRSGSSSRERQSRKPTEEIITRPTPSEPTAPTPSVQKVEVHVSKEEKKKKASTPPASTTPKSPAKPASDYTGLSSEKPMKQVTTKSDDKIETKKPVEEN